MSESIKCPTCGYTKLEAKGFRETGFIDGRGCPYCECVWDEHKRQPVNAWIPCSERMPGKFMKVDFVNEHEGFLYIGYNINGDDDGWHDSEYDIAREGITHWQPRPEPPATGKGVES